MKEITTINLILFTPNEFSQEVAPAIWTAFKEIEAFYNSGTQRLDFRSFDLGGAIPEKKDGSITRQIQDTLRRDVKEQAQGKFSKTLDAKKVCKLVDNLLGEDIEAKIIVVDEELTPPSGWRYIIWRNQVVSIVPVDPKHWGISDQNRVALIKHRVRTACLSMVGSLIGLRRCSNENCFLYSNVDSVNRLDAMVKFGSEHRITNLQDRGFDVLSEHPETIQPVVMNPNPRGWLLE
jgi:hypothetical protein